MSDKYAEYRRNWMRKNIDKITTQVECKCGKSVPKNNLYNHKKSEYHKIVTEKNEEIEELQEKLELYKSKNKRLREKIRELKE